MEFFKYQGTGNDFVMIDNRTLDFPKNQNLIEKLCHRRFGIGADGLILLENDDNYDFKMVYYNADGREGSMCGNGGRCTVAFAFFLDIFEHQCVFNATDGLHEAEISNGIIKLKMIDVDYIAQHDKDFVMNTGSPHYVQYINDLENFNVFAKGKEIRNSEKFIEEGINVNFVEQISDNQIFVRTFERGVEDETYSCGTGVTASALTFIEKNNLLSVDIKTLGGDLKVHAEKDGNSYKNIWLEGPAKQVFKGKIEI